MVCTACTADVPDDDLFCENCGAKLPHAETAFPGCSCGAAVGEEDEDGFCLCCGRRLRRPASDHIEHTLHAGCAAVSDRGLRHDRNEDRFALVRAESGYGIVVCDGVSATDHAEAASASASEATAGELERALREGLLDGAEQALRTAIAQAASGLMSPSEAHNGDAAASTTLVAALVNGGEITIAWVGDSRAYWIDEEGAHLLTHDHSWVNAVVEAGAMSVEDAQESPQAHAITRWLGADAGDAATPEFVQHTVLTDGTLLLCSDGLWNYDSSAEVIASLLSNCGNADALDAARALVNFANEQGGRDNITVALLRLPAPEQEPAPAPVVN